MLKSESGGLPESVSGGDRWKVRFLSLRGKNWWPKHIACDNVVSRNANEITRNIGGLGRVLKAISYRFIALRNSDQRIA